jgi:hypothetical protein
MWQTVAECSGSNLGKGSVCYLINQTPVGRWYVNYAHGRAYCSLSNEFSTERLRAYVNVLKIKLYISTSYIRTIKVIIYFINAIDSLGNYIYIFIDYNPLLRILKGGVYRRKT